MDLRAGIRMRARGCCCFRNNRDPAVHGGENGIVVIARDDQELESSLRKVILEYNFLERDMHTTNLRKVGLDHAGRAAGMLDILRLRAGAKVGLTVQRGRLVVEPQSDRATLSTSCWPNVTESAAQQGRPRMARRRTCRQRADLMKRGEIWLVGRDPTRGHEQRGWRPVLIVSPEAFNRVTKVPVVLPITSGGNFARTAGFAVKLEGAGDENDRHYSLRPTPRARSERVGGKKLEQAPDAIVDEALAKLTPIFE